MTRAEHHPPPRLKFERVAIEPEDGGSLALLFERVASRCGIYRIDFANGESYVGQSVTARSRLATHRRRWSDAVSIGFAECDRDRLDDLERSMISYVEQSRPVRNKLLTNRPGGAGDLIVESSEGVALALPWDRSRRTAPALASIEPPAGSATPRQHAALARLKAREDYPSVRRILRSIVTEATPAPAHTQSLLWTVTALPSTASGYGQRLATLNAGRLELVWLFAQDAAGSDVAMINLHPETDVRVLRKILRRHRISRFAVRRHDYSSMTSVVTVATDSLDDLAMLLEEPFILDSAYRLVATMMRQGLNPLRRHHNWALAADLLTPDGGTVPLAADKNGTARAL